MIPRQAYSFTLGGRTIVEHWEPADWFYYWPVPDWSTTASAEPLTYDSTDWNAARRQHSQWWAGR